MKAQRDSSLDSTSSSSEDHPLRETPTGTKRKAEVLKESGKIGVTIKTSPPMTSTSLSSATSPNSSGKSTPNQATQKPAADLSPKTPSGKTGSQAPLPQQQQQQHKTHLETVPPARERSSSTGSNKQSTLQVSVPVANRSSQSNQNATEPQAPLSPETPASRPESNTPPEQALGKNDRANEVAGQQPRRGGVLPEGNGEQQREVMVDEPQQRLPGEEEEEENNNVCPEKISRRELPMSPKTVAPRLWLPKNRNTDQVFITDVTVNLQTVTIRECKTGEGFFREREMTSSTS